MQLALLICTACAVISTIAAVSAWLRSRGTDKRIEGLSATVAQVEASQPHYLTARNLGPIHEKVNAVAQDVAAMRAEGRANAEQLRLITRHLMKTE